MKKGTILFFVGLLLIVLTAVFLKFGTISLFTSNRAKFSVSEFISLMDNYQTGVIAESCVNKDFIGFEKYEDQRSKCFYYHVTGFHSENLKKNEDKCAAKADEIVLFFKDAFGLQYTLLNGKAYHNFIDSMNSLHPETLSTDMKTEKFKLFPHITVKNCLFVVKGYVPESKYYRILVFPKDDYLRTRKDEIANMRQLQEQRGNRKYAIINVNVAYAFSEPEEYELRRECTLKKGDSVEIIGDKGNFLFCNYKCNDCSPRTAYILKESIKALN